MSRILSASNYCVHAGCTSNARTPGRRLYRFPKDEQRCKLWVKAAKNPRIYNVPANKLYKNSRLCDKHFHSWCFMNANDKKNLVFNAVPDQLKPVRVTNLPSINLPCEVASENEIEDASNCGNPSLTPSALQAHNLNHSEYVSEQSSDVEIDTEEASEAKLKFPLEKEIWLWEKEEHEKQMSVLEHEWTHMQERLEWQRMEHEKRTTHLRVYHAIQMKNLAALHAAQMAAVKKANNIYSLHIQRRERKKPYLRKRKGNVLKSKADVSPITVCEVHIGGAKSDELTLEHFSNVNGKSGCFTQHQ